MPQYADNWVAAPLHTDLHVKAKVSGHLVFVAMSYSRTDSLMAFLKMQSTLLSCLVGAKYEKKSLGLETGISTSTVCPQSDSSQLLPTLQGDKYTILPKPVKFKFCVQQHCMILQ